MNRERNNITRSRFNSYSSETNNLASSSEDIQVFEALKDISKIAFPTMFFFIGVYMQQTFNLIFIGHSYTENQKEALDAVGISHLYINCTLLSFVIGLISGFDTLGSNSYGAKSYYLFGIYFHRSMLIAFSVTSVLFIFHFFYAVSILGYLGIEENVLVLVSDYIHVMMFWVLPDVAYSVMFRYLNIVGKAHVNLNILIISLAIHPIWCYIFISKLGWGVKGAGFSLFLTHLLNAFFTAYYIWKYNPVPESIFPLNQDSFKGWYDYLKIALPATFLMCAEWLAFEVTAIITIWIGKLDYTVHILLTNLSLNLFTFSFGFAITSCVIVGNSIVTKSVEYVKKYAIIVYLFGTSLLIFVLFIIFINRNNLLYIFTKDEEIISYGKVVIPLLCLYKISDIIGGISAGVFRGLGKQMIASQISFVNFYITQIFFTIYLGKYLQMGVYGVWIGIVIGSASNSVSFLYVLWNFDYHQIKKEIKFRLEHDSKLIDTSENNNGLNKNSEARRTSLTNKIYEKELNVIVAETYFV